MAKDKYEVVDFTAGGFFVHGGRLGDTYFKEKVDAQLVCDALNMVERLKARRVHSKIREALGALEQLDKGLREEEIGYY